MHPDTTHRGRPLYIALGFLGLDVPPGRARWKRGAGSRAEPREELNGASLRSFYVTGLLLAICLQVTQGCATPASPRRLDSASLVGLWKGEVVDTPRDTGASAARRSTPMVLRIAAMKGDDTAAVGHYGDTQATARVYITVVRTEHRIRIRFRTDSGHRAELTLVDDDRLVGYLHSGSVARPMKLLRVRSTSNHTE
jgi:hypothetical protein